MFRETGYSDLNENFHLSLDLVSLIASLSNEDGDGKKTTTLHVHQPFLNNSLPWLHDYNVKVPHFTSCQEREHKTTTFFFFPEL